jgi:hypothetical protein
LTAGGTAAGHDRDGLLTPELLKQLRLYWRQ